MKNYLKSSALLIAVITMASCGGSKKQPKTEASATAEVTIPAMAPQNPWLAQSSFPISHDNSAATDAVVLAGPTEGKQLTASDVKTITTPWTCSPVIKKIGDETIIIGAGCDGIRKIKATGESFELISYIPYPGFEALEKIGKPELVDAALAKVNAAYKAKDDAKLLALTKDMAAIGFDRKYLVNGGYNMIDKDGYHYAAYGGMKIVKSYDDNQVDKPLYAVKSNDFLGDLPNELRTPGVHLVGMNMTFDGHIAAAANNALLLIDRDLKLVGLAPFPGEAVENSICVDEKGIYVVTSKNMYKFVWTGSKLSCEEADGGWKSGYNTMSHERALAAGALTVSGGCGTTPSLMGFGEGEDKLVIISDADSTGIHVVAFWRDEIPADFQQKSGTKSRRIADQAVIDISKVTIEPSPLILGYGTVLMNSTYPKPVPDIWGNIMTSGITRPFPAGIQKFTWNPKTRSFDKNWTNMEIDNTDIMVPVVSATTQMMYLPNKVNGIYEYVGVDWNTGEIKARWPFPDDSRTWNAWGGITALMDDGDLLFGGIFSVKRVNIGTNK